jgi:hypothetical protein
MRIYAANYSSFPPQQYIRPLILVYSVTPSLVGYHTGRSQSAWAAAFPLGIKKIDQHVLSTMLKDSRRIFWFDADLHQTKSWYIPQKSCVRILQYRQQETIMILILQTSW